MRSGVFAKIGKDPNGAFLLGELRGAGVATDGMRVSPTEATPFTFVGIHPSGDRTFIHTPGTNLSFSPDDLAKDKLFDCDFLLFQDVWVLPRLEGAPGAELLREARQRGIVTFLDECYGLGPDKAVLETMAPFCDHLMPSYDDLRVIYPRMDEERMAEHLLALGAGHVIIKMGARGCYVAAAGQRRHIAPLRARVLDATGAGDCWDAGYIAGLARGRDIVAAAMTGNAAAAFCLEASGGSAGVPKYRDIERRADAGCVGG